MALQKPSARTLRTQRLTGAIHPHAPFKTFRPEASTSDTFLSSKLDKRLIKHSSFISRITASSPPSSRISKSRRREPPTPRGINQSLSVLADALPELDDDDVPDGKVHHKSLKSKKGALKRKERVVKGEIERFGASMAQLKAVNSLPAIQQQQQQQNETQNVTTNRWAALRGFISTTMKQNPVFEKQ